MTKLKYKVAYTFDQSFQEWKKCADPAAHCSCEAPCDHMHDPTCSVAEAFGLWASLGVEKNAAFKWVKLEETPSV